MRLVYIHQLGSIHLRHLGEADNRLHEVNLARRCYQGNGNARMVVQNGVVDAIGQQLK
jgi:hypothetical protein